MTVLPGSGWRPGWWNSRLPTPDEARAIRDRGFEPAFALSVRIAFCGLALSSMPAARAAWVKSPEAGRLDEATRLRVAATWNRAEAALIQGAEEEAAGIGDGPGAVAAVQALDRLQAAAAPWRLPDATSVFLALVAHALAILPDAFAQSKKARGLGAAGMQRVRAAAEAARAAVLDAAEAVEARDGATSSRLAAERLGPAFSALREALHDWRPSLPLLPVGLPRLPRAAAAPLPDAAAWLAGLPTQGRA